MRHAEVRMDRGQNTMASKLCHGGRGSVTLPSPGWYELFEDARLSRQGSAFSYLKVSAPISFTWQAAPLQAEPLLLVWQPQDGRPRWLSSYQQEAPPRLPQLQPVRSLAWRRPASHLPSTRSHFFLALSNVKLPWRPSKSDILIFSVGNLGAGA